MCEKIKLLNNPHPPRDGNTARYWLAVGEMHVLTAPRYLQFCLLTPRTSAGYQLHIMWARGRGRSHCDSMLWRGYYDLTAQAGVMMLPRAVKLTEL